MKKKTFWWFRKKKVYRTSDDLFFLTRQTLIGLTRGNYLSSRNYRNRWRGRLFLKKRLVRRFFFHGASKVTRPWERDYEIRDNVATTRIAAPWRSKLSRLTPQLKRFRNTIAETRGGTIFVYNKSFFRPAWNERRRNA